MSEAALRLGPAPAATPLERMFGLDAEEEALLLRMLRDAVASEGLNADGFLGALAKGTPVAGALGLPPAVVEVLYARAHQWFTVGRPARAEPLFRALCFADGKVADFWIGHGVCLRLRDEFAGAEVAFSTAAGLSPSWAVPPFHLAELAMRRGDWTAAGRWLTAFSRAADADTPEAMRLEAGRLADALAIRQAAADASPAGGGRRE